MENETLDKSESKIIIVLLSLGEPNNSSGVPSYLFSLFSDPDLIKFPLIIRPFQKLIAKKIVNSRTSVVVEKYDEIGYGHLVKNTEDLSREINKQLINLGVDGHTSYIMRYSEPRAEELLNNLKDQLNDNDTLVLFPQYPHYTQANSGSSLNDFYASWNNSKLTVRKIIEISEWGMEDVYINWWVNQIIDNFENMKSVDKTVHIIFSAHGLPLSHIRKGEDYPQRIEAATNKIVSKLSEYVFSYTVAYQSQSGPAEWTRPYTDDVIIEISQNKPTALLIVPLGFVTDHLETLHELDIEYAEIAKKAGIDNYIRIRVPNADVEYSRELTRMILDRIEKD